MGAYINVLFWAAGTGAGRHRQLAMLHNLFEMLHKERSHAAQPLVDQFSFDHVAVVTSITTMPCPALPRWEPA